MMKPADKKEAFPLSWPEDWQRTRPQDRKSMGSWKRTANQYREALVTELTRMQSPSAVISSNVPLNLRGGLETKGVEPLDVGVAVYFSRPIKKDFSWQDALGIHDPAPTEEQVQAAYRKLAAQYHPDRGGDIAMFQSVTRHRDNALRWINRKTSQQFDYVIACDQFREVRLNMAAIVMTIKAIRQIERCGTSSLLERAFKGFSALPAYAGEADTVGAR
jgi:hypothetical protein